MTALNFILLLVLGAISLVLLAVLLNSFLRWWRADDRAAGILTGQASRHEGPGLPWPRGVCHCDACMVASGLEPWPDPPPETPAESALVRACGGCWTVLGTSPKTVFPGQRLLLSTREVCPKCAAGHGADEERLLHDEGTSHAHAYSH